MGKFIPHRPIIITANSSFYLIHYRKLLIKKLSKKNNLVTISPKDFSTKQLSKLSVNLPWRIDRSKDRNLSSFFLSLLRMLFLVRAVKPKLIHSHTLRTNLIIAIVCSFYGIPCILSFTGLGLLSKDNSSSLLFKIVLKTIMFFSVHERKGIFRWQKSYKRSRFIFQNKNDKFIFTSTNKNSEFLSNVIFGSGIPKEYFLKKFNTSNWTKINPLQFNAKLQFIFCARLLVSKGIKTFIELSKSFPEHDFIIFGEFDYSSKDSINKKEFLDLCENKNITFKGHQKNPLLKNKYQNPVLIVPSYYGEGLPRAILEAFSLKIPVICSKQATINLFTKKELYIVDYKGYSYYYSALKKFIIDSKNGKVKKKINKAFRLSKNFSEEKIVSQTQSLYEQLL